MEEVRQLTTTQVLLDVARDAAATGSSVAGNGVDRLESVLNNADAYELVTGPVTKRQLLQVAKENANVFIGEFSICVFGPGGLCGNEEEADFKLCRPFACKNSAMTKSQRARLELRRRAWEPLGGVFDRARRKIEQDVPGLAREFKAWNDARLRNFVLDDLPGRYMQAARGVDET
ncbi:hypothetical protein [Nesterenkonia sp. CF4.4]|uniref:hypothetical protein n=1 Tax=Nesterenkonia sp. CF4.4 TaxID=3373079 RepID=UPI003EE4B93B